MLEFDPRRLRKFVRALDSDLPAHLRAPDGDLSVALFDDARIAKIHADFMNIPTATDSRAKATANLRGKFARAPKLHLRAPEILTTRLRASCACMWRTDTCILPEWTM